MVGNRWIRGGLLKNRVDLVMLCYAQVGCKHTMSLFVGGSLLVIACYWFFFSLRSGKWREQDTMKHGSLQECWLSLIYCEFNYFYLTRVDFTTR